MNKNSKSKEDASPLTTSTESETFDTWTVITDKTKDFIHDEIPSPPPTPEKIEEHDDIGEDAVRVEVFKASDDQLENRYTDIDDLSDGISIISECESVGRISPHPELRKHLSELNMRFVDVIQPSLQMTNSAANSTSKNYEGSSENSTDGFNHQVEPLMEDNRRPRRASRQVANSSDFQPTLRSGLRGLFYVGAMLGILAFISKLKYESVLGTNTDVLNQKIDDLELKNNLMRAEIDILAKQVNYLTKLSETQKYSTSNKPKSNPSKEKKIKVWPGNGNTIEEVVITPKDLKTPFKCDGHNNLDIAGMCVELPKSSENIVESLGEKVRSVIDENEHFTNFEKVVDKVVKLTENPFSEKDYNPTDTILGNDKLNSKEYQQKNNDYTPHEHKPDKYDNKKYGNEHKPGKYDNKKYENEQSSKKHENKRENFKKHKNDDSGESKERYRRDRSNEDFGGSGERIKKSKDYKKYDKYSSSENENAKRDADGQWHEKLMQHRENSRKNNDKQRHDKNWYIERGDSREQARVTEQKYR